MSCPVIDNVDIEFNNVDTLDDVIFTLTVEDDIEVSSVSAEMFRDGTVGVIDSGAVRLIDFSAESIEGSSQQKSIRFSISTFKYSSSYDGVQKYLILALVMVIMCCKLQQQILPITKATIDYLFLNMRIMKVTEELALKNNDFEGKLPSIDLSFDRLSQLLIHKHLKI